MKTQKLIFIALLFMALIACKKKEDAPEPVLFKAGYDHKLLIIGVETFNAGQPNEDNVIWILNNTGADINLSDYKIKEKANAWTQPGDAIVVKTAEQYNQHCPSINQSYDQLSIYTLSNSLVFTYYR